MDYDVTLDESYKTISDDMQIIEYTINLFTKNSYITRSELISNVSLYLKARNENNILKEWLLDWIRFLTT
jgi:hypothetical protein